MFFQMVCIRADQVKNLDRLIMRLFYQKIYLTKNTRTFYVFTVKKQLPYPL